MPERRVVTVDRRQGRLLDVHNEREGQFALVYVLCRDRHIDNLLHFLASNQVGDHVADLLGRQRPGEGGSGLGSSSVEVVKQLDTVSSGLSHGTYGMIGSGDFGSSIGCDELSLRQTVLTEFAEYLGNHLFPSERTLEGIASQRVVERLENLQVNRSDLLLQPLYLEVTNVNDGVLVVHVNQLDTYDRRLVDSSLVVSRAVGQFRGQRPRAVRIGYAGEFLLVGIVVTYLVRLGRQYEAELEAGSLERFLGDLFGFIIVDIATGNHRQQVDRLVVCFGERRIGSLCSLIISREVIVIRCFIALEFTVLALGRVQVDQGGDFRLDSRFGQRNIVRIYGSAYFAFAEVFVCEGHFQGSRVDVFCIQRKSGTCCLLHVYGQHTACDIPRSDVQQLLADSSARANFSLLEHETGILDILFRNDRGAYVVAYRSSRSSSRRGRRTLCHGLGRCARGYFPCLVRKRFQLDGFDAVDIQVGDQQHAGQTTGDHSLQVCDSIADSLGNGLVDETVLFRNGILEVLLDLGVVVVDRLGQLGLIDEVGRSDGSIERRLECILASVAGSRDSCVLCCVDGILNSLLRREFTKIVRNSRYGVTHIFGSCIRRERRVQIALSYIIVCKVFFDGVDVLLELILRLLQSFDILGIGVSVALELVDPFSESIIGTLQVVDGCLQRTELRLQSRNFTSGQLVEAVVKFVDVVVVVFTTDTG